MFLHLLPHAFLGEHVEDHAAVAVDEQKNVLIGLGIFGGFFFFFVMDKLMRVFNGGSGHDHHHHHHPEVDTKKHDDTDSAVEDHPHHNHNNHNDNHHHNHDEGLRQRKGATADETKADDKRVEKKTSSEEGIKLSAYLNLFADFTHNMTDGLAMAASFYASPSVGATTAVAVFFHEIPHEVGDYAILIQSGFSKQRAMLAQFTTAVGAFLGTIIGICIEQMAKTEVKDHVVGLLGTDLQWGDLVIPFTAGGFMYIATVGVVPELLEVTGKLVKDRRQALAEFTAMLVGVSLMGVIAWNEGSA